MKKLLRTLTSFAVVVGVVSVGLSAPTYAVECDDLVISNTGEGSTNIIECETITEVIVECENNVIVANASYLDAQSGNAVGTGSVSTGTAVNYNGTEVTVGADCGTTPETPATPTGSTTPQTPANTTPQPANTPAANTPTTLPNTANNSFAIVAYSLIALAAIAVISRVGLAVYRRTLK